MVTLSDQAMREAEGWADFLRQNLQGIRDSQLNTPLQVYGDEFQDMTKAMAAYRERLQTVSAPIRAMIGPDTVKLLEQNLAGLQEAVQSARARITGGPDKRKSKTTYRTHYIRLAISNWARIWEQDTGQKASQYELGDFFAFASEMLERAGVTANHRHLIVDALRGGDPHSAPVPAFSLK